MAKPRKNHISRKKPQWQIVAFYIVIALIITLMLYYSGLLNTGIENNLNFTGSDYSYFE